jgi:uncharacterized membrane protein YkoI
MRPTLAAALLALPIIAAPAALATSQPPGFTRQAPAEPPVTVEDAIAIARDFGLVMIKEVELEDGYKWEVEGYDADGREVELDISSSNGEILDIDYD